MPRPGSEGEPKAKRAKSKAKCEAKPARGRQAKKGCAAQPDGPGPAAHEEDHSEGAGSDGAHWVDIRRFVVRVPVGLRASTAAGQEGRIPTPAPAAPRAVPPMPASWQRASPPSSSAAAPASPPPPV
eukprot:7518020-Lingulodinium_polyedra.AAC.1